MKSFPFLCNVSEMIVRGTWTFYLDSGYVRLISSLSSVTERRMKSAVAVCRPTKDHWMNLNGFQLDTEVILELLWCLAVLSGELCGLCRSVWVVASVWIKLSGIFWSSTLCGYALQTQYLPITSSWQLKLGLFPEWNWKYWDNYIVVNPFYLQSGSCRVHLGIFFFAALNLDTSRG